MAWDKYIYDHGDDNNSGNDIKSEKTVEENSTGTLRASN